MSVVYSCVAYKQTPLVHCGRSEKVERQFSQDIEEVLANFVNRDNMRTCQPQDNMNFYVLLQNQIVFCAFCEKQVSKNAAYAMLNDMSEAFTQKYSLAMAKQAVKFQMDREFGGTLKRKMEAIKTYQQSQSSEILKEVEEVKGLVMQNIEAVMKRANQLQDIENDAEELRDNAEEFMTASNDLKKAMMCKKIAMIVGICLAIVAIVLVIVLPIVL
ncbi:Synaptobrevin [Hexamita inflata]|uniref:Synaptobrevin n=1 Tax=Hexamita inflata TaxID=28002 RepID=A0AA86NZV4_9EUKA|nr:Synaptobrevin [Hexamita inflata]CAI9927874.1 Synaptobrevin [Hexamita inflata]CAI9972085.1 Synaptobrevin [Hexamita inflata]